MITVQRVAALLVLILPGYLPFHAIAAAAKRVDLHMVMYMAGVTAGTMTLSVEFNDDDAVSRLKLKSKGLMKLMTGYQGKSQSRSTLPDRAPPMPISYDSAYETNKYDRKVLIRYDPDDGDITELRTWKRGKPRSIKVPEHLRLETIDPLTAMLRFRYWVLDVRAGRSVADQRIFEIFDGRRRYRLRAEILDRGRFGFDGGQVDAFRFKVVMKPIAGFSAKDMLARWSSENGERWIELFVTDDDNPSPLSLETKGGGLKTRILLKKACTDQACIKFDS